MTTDTVVCPPRKGLLICVSGPSGVGKGTMIRKIREIDPCVAHSISVTTRNPRRDEIEGVSYYFRSKEAFEQMLASGEILEHDSYCGNDYGTPRTPLARMVEQGIDVVMDITVPGSLSVMENYPGVITVFLMPPSYSELRRRLMKRGTEDETVMELRMKKARDEIRQCSLFQYVVVNDDLDTAARRILGIIEAERCRYKNMKGIEDQVLAL
ncbi:MAG TPA: guanylate kinase [Clostridiales bacterium]|nr:guanylate kinase [Clostridiales bacterium]